MTDKLYVCALCDVRLAYQVALFTESGAEVPSCSLCLSGLIFEGIPSVAVDIPDGFIFKG